MPEVIEPQLDELRRRARRRLIGAVVLALAAAVLVPMLLESDPKPLGEDISVRIPPVDDQKFVSKLGEKTPAGEGASTASVKPVPATAPMASDTATAASAKDASREAAAGLSASAKRPPQDALPAAQAPQTKSAVKEGSTPPVKDLPSGVSSSTSPSRSVSDAGPSDATKGATPPAAAFSVQLAAFADDKGASALANRLKKSGHPAYTEAYATSRGTLWRVRVGPYVTREAAENARTRLKADGQNGIIATAN